MKKWVRLCSSLLSPAAGVRFLGGVAREDPLVFRAVCAWTAFQLSLIAWDLPGLVGWENDGVAPRGFFSAVGENLSPGRGYRYPLFHGVLLLLCCVPVLLVCLLTGAPSDLLGRVRSVPAMTAFSLVVRLVHVLMGSAALLVLARIGRRLFSPAAGRFTVLAWASCLTVGYYARASNLDGPYMFWTVLAVDRALSVFAEARARDFALLGVLIALSVATKDQAYASYLLAFPAYFVALPWIARLPDRGARLRLLARTAGAAAATYALAAGVLFNPTGFVARVRMLLGPNSQDWRSYERSWAGVWLNVQDLWSAQPVFMWGPGLGLLAWGGLLVALFAPSGEGLQRRVYRAFPLLVGLSSLVAFTLAVARADPRSDQRFVLPLATWLCVYAGAGAATLQRVLRWRGAFILALLGLVLPSSRQVLSLAFSQWHDPRWRVTELLAQLPSGSRVEVYGTTAYLPQLDLSAHAPYRVERLEGRPASVRARLPGLVEVEGAYGDVAQRRPEIVLVSEAFATQYLPRRVRPGESQSVVRARLAADRDGVRFFAGAVRGQVVGYRLLCALDAELPELLVRVGAEPVRVHDSTGQRQWLFAREDVRFSPSCR